MSIFAPLVVNCRFSTLVFVNPICLLKSSIWIGWVWGGGLLFLCVAVLRAEDKLMNWHHVTHITVADTSVLLDTRNVSK